MTVYPIVIPIIADIAGLLVLLSFLFSLTVILELLTIAVLCAFRVVLVEGP